MKKIFVALVILIISAAPPVKGQVEEAGVILQRLYKAYDSIAAFKFDVTYTYASDTLYGDYLHDVVKGSYIIDRKNAKYNLGNIYFVQNEHFFVSVYKDQKFIIMSRSRPHGGSFLPMRQTIDSLLGAYSAQYSISLNMNVDSTEGEILFTSTDTTSAFTSFKITYDNRVALILSLDYTFKGPPQLFRLTDNNSQALIENGIITARRQDLKIHFSNYSFALLEDKAFDIEKYVWYDAGEWKPTPEYRDFRIFYTDTN